MAHIERLSPEVIGKIAAGEVVERPAAAIKELVENSMDAGASAVTIEIRDGGISYIRVTDNGGGIPHPEIRMAFERHATSKISQAEDLHHIQTLGFRGEAIASIAAVSRMECTTRTRSEDHGIIVVNEGGIIRDIRDAACPEGTTMIVRDLFFNTPVRLKFLKKPATEAGLVSDLVMRLILSRPDISFRLLSQGKTIYHSPGDGKLSSAVFSIYGREMLNSMRYLQDTSQGIQLSGYVGIGDSARGTRSHQSFFINGRYMKSLLLSQAVEQGCRERVTIGHFPICVFHLSMPYETVDVNVHPNKLEVRFQNETAVFESVRDMIADTLRRDTTLDRIPEMTLSAAIDPLKSDNRVNVQKIDPEMRRTVGIEPRSIAESITRRDSEPKSINNKTPAENNIPNSSLSRLLDIPLPSPGERTQTKVLQESNIAPMMTAPIILKGSDTYAIHDKNPPKASTILSEKVEELPPISKEYQKLQLRVLGVLFQTYILIEYGEQLLLIDQHAAHERLLYDQMMQALDRHAASQALLVPQVLSLSHREMEILFENQQALQETGFDIESFGEAAVQVRSVPMILGEPQVKTFLLEILDQLETMRGLSTLEKRRTAIVQMACKRAVKGGEQLSQLAIEDLVRRTTETGTTPTCPHGRPLVIAITHQDLDKRFKRIQ